MGKELLLHSAKQLRRAQFSCTSRRKPAITQSSNLSESRHNLVLAFSTLTNLQCFRAHHTATRRCTEHVRFTCVTHALTHFTRFPCSPGPNVLTNTGTNVTLCDSDSSEDASLLTPILCNLKFAHRSALHKHGRGNVKRHKIVLT
jgi:hypothetical protein